MNKLLRNCHNKSGIHYFGRSRMNFIIPEKSAEVSLFWLLKYLFSL